MMCVTSVCENQSLIARRCFSAASKPQAAPAAAGSPQKQVYLKKVWLQYDKKKTWSPLKVVGLQTRIEFTFQDTSFASRIAKLREQALVGGGAERLAKQVCPKMSDGLERSQAHTNV